MEILFLGSGGGRYMISTQIRKTAGFAITFNSKNVLYVDPGPCVINSIRKYKLDVRRIKYIYVSHNHLDHANGLLPLLQAIELFNPRKKLSYLIVPIDFIEFKDTTTVYIPNYFRNMVEKIITIDKPFIELDFPEFKLKTTPTRHLMEYDFGFIIEEKISGKKIGYLSDTAYFEDLNKVFTNLDVVIINSCLIKKIKGVNKHFSFEDFPEFYLNTNNKIYILNHICLNFSKHIKEIRETLYKLEKEKGNKIIVSYDGLKIYL